jgi:hypothetical protein
MDDNNQAALLLHQACSEHTPLARSVLFARLMRDLE